MVGDFMGGKQTAMATLLLFGLAFLPPTLLAQRRGPPDRGGMRVGAGFGHRGGGHHGFGHHGFGQRGFGHRGTRVGIGVGVHRGHVSVGVGLGFDSYHHHAVRPRFFRRGFAPFGFGGVRYYYYPAFVPYVPVYPSTTVIVVPGYGQVVNNGYYVDPPGEQVSQRPAPESRYVVESGSAGPVRQPARLILLAFQDHSIYAATDYWVEGDTLFYTTSYGARNQTPLAALDLDLTIQLNRERGIEFSLESHRVR